MTAFHSVSEIILPLTSAQFQLRIFERDIWELKILLVVQTIEKCFSNILVMEVLFPMRNLSLSLPFLCRLYGGMNYRRLGGGVGVIKMTHCESHIWWTSGGRWWGCSAVFGSTLTLELSTARENTRTNSILCRCLNLWKYEYQQSESTSPVGCHFCTVIFSSVHNIHFWF